MARRMQENVDGGARLYGDLATICSVDKQRHWQLSTLVPVAGGAVLLTSGQLKCIVETCRFEFRKSIRNHIPVTY